MNVPLFVIIVVQEFTEGLLDHVTILVGIAVGEEAVSGVINEPFFNYKPTGILKYESFNLWGLMTKNESLNPHTTMIPRAFSGFAPT